MVQLIADFVKIGFRFRMRQRIKHRCEIVKLLVREKNLLRQRRFRIFCLVVALVLLLCVLRR